MQPPQALLIIVCIPALFTTNVLSTSVVKSILFLYLSKSINTAMLKHSATSKSLELKMYLSKSMKVLASKCA